MTNLSKQFQAMTDTELNKKICEKLGICWHEPLFKGSKVCRLCGTYCDAESMSEFNPNFTQNAAVLLKAIKGELGEERHMLFMAHLEYVDNGHIEAQDWSGMIDVDYVTNPRSLCEKFLDFMEGK